MISKLARVRLLALLCSPLLGIAIGVASSLSMLLTLRLMPNTDASIWEPVSYVMAWIPITLLVAGLAAILGAYDLLVIVTCIVPALLYFGSSYAMDVSTFLPDNGHTMYDILGAIPPFDYADQLWFLFRLLAWALATAAVGIALKRWIVWARGKAAPANLGPAENRRLWRGLVFDVGFLFLVMSVVLFLDLRQRLRLGDPDAILASVTQVLDSPASTPADREGALSHMEEFSDKFRGDAISSAVAMLRREVQSQPVPVNLVVAKTLITFRDFSALPLIENALLHSSDPGAVAPPGGWGYLALSLDVIKDPAALSALIQLFDSPDADIRYGAIQGIRNFHTPDAIPPLIKGLDDPDARVRKSSEWGLGLLLGSDERRYGWYPPHYDSPASESEAYVDSLKTWAKAWQANQ